MRERDIEQYLVERVKALGGEVRKVKWIGRNGAPDRLVMLPMRPASPSRCQQVGVPHGTKHLPAAIWCELKAPGEKCKPHQQREHERMRKMGQLVEVVDSFERVDEVLA